MEKKETDLDWRLPVPAQDSATLRISNNIQRISILSALNEVLKERRSLEHRRNTLLQSAVLRQHQVQELKDKCEARWLEKIEEVKKIGENFEKECSDLRDRREQLHKANYKIQACQLQKDIADLKRRVNHTKLRLDAEKKIASSLSNTVKELRVEASTKKFDSMSLRPRTLAILSHPTYSKTSRESFKMKNTPRFIDSVRSWSKAL